MRGTKRPVLDYITLEISNIFSKESKFSIATRKSTVLLILPVPLLKGTRKRKFMKPTFSHLF